MVYFESREARVESTEETIYSFVTDIRNFERFIPRDSVRNWQATKNTCSFEIPYAGKSGFAITHRNPFSEVNYTGKGLQDTEISFKISILKGPDKSTLIKVFIQASLNPVLKMMVSKPLEQFLEKMVTEMEKFTDWDKTIE